MPSPSLWVTESVDEKPRPPSRIDRSSSWHMASSSAWLASDPTARSPITTRRRAECPTRKPAFTASRPSSRSRYSPKERQSQGTPSRRLSSGMPSTRASMRIR